VEIDGGTSRLKRKRNWIGIACLLCAILLVALLYGSLRASNYSDWVLETLEDHTSIPPSKSELRWLLDREQDLDVAVVIPDSNISYARSIVQLSIVYIYFDKLSSKETERMLKAGQEMETSDDADIKRIGALLRAKVDQNRISNPYVLNAQDIADILKFTRANKKWLKLSHR
jgi:hypothetical protein